MLNVIHTPYIKSIRFYPGGFSLFKSVENKEKAFIYKDCPNTSLSSLAVYLSRFFPSLSPEHKETVDIVMADTVPVLVPKDLYEEARKTEYLKYQVDISSVGKVSADEAGEYRLLYPVPEAIVNCLNKLPLNMNIRHRFANLYDNVLALRKAGSENMLFAYFEQEHADFFLQKSGKLALLNRFAFTSDFDVLYYILNILKQVQVTSQKCDVILSGSVDQKSELCKLLRQYLPQSETVPGEAISVVDEAGKGVLSGACFDLLKFAE